MRFAFFAARVRGHFYSTYLNARAQEGVFCAANFHEFISARRAAPSLMFPELSGCTSDREKLIPIR